MDLLQTLGLAVTPCIRLCGLHRLVEVNMEMHLLVLGVQGQGGGRVFSRAPLSGLEDGHPSVCLCPNLLGPGGLLGTYL
jgi:hypothetical protein